jgi:lipoprotein-anchoring transpeptidase ErfK/SrfK
VHVLQGSYGNWGPLREMICSPGAPATPTVRGVFEVDYKGYAFGYGHGYTCYYFTSFYGDYLFHSVLYNEGTFVIQDGRLGMHLSHGCVRMDINDAKWIYDNMPYGTTVVVY